MKRIALILGASFLLATQLPSQEKGGTPGVVVDKEKRTITIDAKIAPRKLPHLKEVYPLEVIATWPHPKGKKAHETIVTIDESIKPSAIHKAIESLGLKPGAPVMGGKDQPQGPAVAVYFLIPDVGGIDKKVTVDKAMVDPKNGKPFPKTVEWRFTGSALAQPDASKEDKVYGADVMGTFIAIFPVTKETVLQTSLVFEDQNFLKMEVAKVMPKEGTPVKLVIEVKK
jgi:hypothetical protein